MNSISLILLNTKTHYKRGLAPPTFHLISILILRVLLLLHSFICLEMLASLKPISQSLLDWPYEHIWISTIMNKIWSKITHQLHFFRQTQRKHPLKSLKHLCSQRYDCRVTRFNNFAFSFNSYNCVKKQNDTNCSTILSFCKLLRKLEQTL